MQNFSEKDISMPTLCLPIFFLMPTLLTLKYFRRLLTFDSSPPPPAIDNDWSLTLQGQKKENNEKFRGVGGEKVTRMMV